MTSGADALHALIVAMRRTIPLAARLAGLLLVLFAASPFPGAAAADQVLRIGLPVQLATLDPHRAVNLPDNRVLNNLYEPLLRLNGRGEIVPAAAERWEVSPDGLTVRFTLRSDGRWSNGDPVTAQDFVWSWRRAALPTTNPAVPQVFFDIVNGYDVVAGKLPPEALGVSAVDARTLEVRLVRPSFEFLENAAAVWLAPLHPATVEKYGKDFVLPSNAVVNGPFLLKVYQPGSDIVLERNPRFRDVGAIRLNEVRYLLTESATTMVNRFRAGEIDLVVGLQPSNIDMVRQMVPEAVRTTPFTASYFLYFNHMREPWMGNRALRQALSLAVDREALAAKIGKAGQVPAWGPVPTIIAGWKPLRPAYASWTQAERDAEARRLIAAAGYGPGGKPLAFELLYNTSEMHKQVAVAVASMWQSKLGAQVTLNNQEFKVVTARQDNRDFPGLVRRGWVQPLPAQHLEPFMTGQGAGNIGYSNAAFDALMQTAATLTDRAAYFAKLAEAEALLVEEAALIPIWNEVSIDLVSPRVRGFIDNGRAAHPPRELWIEP